MAKAIKAKTTKAPEKTITSLSIVKENGLYTPLEITTKGDKVVEVKKLEQPNDKAVATETAKIAFVRLFMSGDLA